MEHCPGEGGGSVLFDVGQFLGSRSLYRLERYSGVVLNSPRYRSNILLGGEELDVSFL